MSDGEKLEYIRRVIQESLNGEQTEDIDFDMLEIALEFVEELQEAHGKTGTILND